MWGFFQSVSSWVMEKEWMSFGGLASDWWAASEWWAEVQLLLLKLNKDNIFIIRLLHYKTLYHTSTNLKLPFPIMPLLSWFLVLKMNRSSWQRRKSLSSSRSSMRFWSQEFFSREICSCARRLVIRRYGLQVGIWPESDSAEALKHITV